MELVVVSNYYPPHEIGGYEIGCRDIVERLKHSGHGVTVLTSRHGVTSSEAESSGIYRRLSLHTRPREFFLRRAWNKVSDLLLFWRLVRRIKPDLVYFWNLSGLTFQLVKLSRWLGCPSVFFLSDGSFIAWKTGAFLRSLDRNPARTFVESVAQRWFGRTSLMRGSSVIEGNPCQFASSFLAELAQQNGIRPAAARQQVIHWGIDPDVFSSRVSALAWPPERFLFVGQIIPQKGVHTLLESFRILLADNTDRGVSLTVAGGSTNLEYEAEMHEFVRRNGLTANISFLSKLPRDKMPAIYSAHDVLVFPSEWDEPFAITPLEAMASGLPVIATNTGGSAEIFRHRENSMLFPAGDAKACAEAITELRRNRGLYEAIRTTARELVLTRFTLDHMAGRIEADLKQVVEST